MPVRNGATTILRAVRSVLDGTLRSIELIVVDDGSTDGSADVVASLKDSRVRVLKSGFEGIATALNIGVKAAAAPFIGRMDVDDIASPYRLEWQVDALRRGQADIVGSRVRIVDLEGNAVASMQRYERWINDHCTWQDISGLRFVESPLVHPSVTARREVFELGYRNGHFPEDYDLWLRAFAAGFRAEKLPDVLLDWVDGPGRLTRCDTRYSPEAFDRCRREYLLQGPLRGGQPVDLWGAGKTGKPWLRWWRRMQRPVRYLYDINPRLIGERIHGVVVETAEQIRAADGTMMIIAVGAEGARELIRPALEAKGYILGRDAWFVA